MIYIIHKYIIYIYIYIYVCIGKNLNIYKDSCTYCAIYQNSFNIRPNFLIKI